MRGKFTLLCGLLLVVSGCGGGSSSGGSTAASVAGNWQMSLQKSGSRLKPRTQSGFLVQNQSAVTGGVMFVDYPCTGVGSLTGSVNGTSVAFTVGLTGLSINLTGTLGSDQASMSGDYTILTSGCETTSGSNQETGTWTANLVKPLSGSFQGTLTSKHLGTAVPVTGQIAQGQNSGISSTSLSGNLSATGYCFASASISGVISGTSAVLNMLSSAGTQIGQVTGTTSLDGTSVTGTYTILPQGASGIYPCSVGDSGSVTLTL